MFILSEGKGDREREREGERGRGGYTMYIYIYIYIYRYDAREWCIVEGYSDIWLCRGRGRGVDRGLMVLS